MSQKVIAALIAAVTALTVLGNATAKADVDALIRRPVLR
jgi:hypothetical protein